MCIEHLFRALFAHPIDRHEAPSRLAIWRDPDLSAKRWIRYHRYYATPSVCPVTFMLTEGEARKQVEHDLVYRGGTAIFLNGVCFQRGYLDAERCREISATIAPDRWPGGDLDRTEAAVGTPTPPPGFIFDQCPGDDEDDNESLCVGCFGWGIECAAIWIRSHKVRDPGTPA